MAIGKSQFQTAQKAPNLGKNEQKKAKRDIVRQKEQKKEKYFSTSSTRLFCWRVSTQYAFLSGRPLGALNTKFNNFEHRCLRMHARLADWMAGRSYTRTPVPLLKRK
jgi:hypothetical protein